MAAKKNINPLLDGIEDGASLEEVIPRLRAAYDLTLDIIDTYVDMAPDYKQILALWILAAGNKQAFNAFPFLYLNASKGSGKTRVMKLATELVPLSAMASSITSSVLFRLAGEKNVLALDEAEKMGSKDMQDLRLLLNSCYKKGGRVYRVEGVKKRVVVEYDVFTAIIIANVEGLDSILEDRCITIVLEKSDNQQIINTMELFEMDPRIKAVREFLASEVYGVQVYGGLCTMLQNLFLRSLQVTLKNPTHYTYNNIYNLYIYKESVDQANENSKTMEFLANSEKSPLAPTLHFVDTEKWCKDIESLHIDGRSKEIWLPILTLAFVINSGELFAKILNLASSMNDTRLEDNTTLDRDTQVAVFLYGFLQDMRFPEVTTKLFRETYEAEEGKQVWMESEWLGLFFKRAKIVKSRKRLGKGNVYTIDMDRLRHYLQIRKALEMAENAKSGDKQRQGKIDTIPESEPIVQKRAIPARPAKDLKVSGLCPECGEVKPLWEFEDKWYCFDNLPIKEV